MSFINTIREDIKTVQAQDPAAQNGLVIGGADGSGVTIEPWTDDVKGEIQLVPVI